LLGIYSLSHICGFIAFINLEHFFYHYLFKFKYFPSFLSSFRTPISII
jgi:hypothetical protein